MKKIVITYGKDTPAYAEKAIEVADDATHDQILQAAKDAADGAHDLVFDPSYDWTGYRIVDITTADGECIANDIPLERSGEDLGLVAQNVLSGACAPQALLDEAERQGITNMDPSVRAGIESMSEHRRLLAHAALIPPFEPFRLIVEAFACDSDGDSPRAGIIQVSQDFLRNLQDKATILEAAGMRLGFIGGDDAAWFDPEDDLRMRGTDLVITPETWQKDRFGLSFWLKGHPKHADYSCETRAVQLDALLGAIRNRAGAESVNAEIGNRACFVWRNGTLFYTDYPGDSADLADVIAASEAQPDDADDQTACAAPGM